MIVVFCCDPFDLKKVDIDYELEYDTVTQLGTHVALVNYDILVNDDDAIQATRGIHPLDRMTVGIYRGWMMKPTHYDKLYHALLEKNIQLINNPAEYMHCHYLPYSYEKIKDNTPASIWCSLDEYYNHFDKLQERLHAFHGKPVILKDYVKSRKHEWHDACYISDASNAIELQRVTNNFITRQAESLNEGLVYREYIELEFLTNHSMSNMPLTKEFRVFVLNKQPIIIFNYWDEGDYAIEHIPVDDYEHIIHNIESQFFTMDIAKKKDSGWTIIEVGDGQVSGLPDNANLVEFYKLLLYHT